ncbi:hypothetical protein J2Z22_000799 [Paenibacillus forsythiae]|uniref:DUF2357 domain-containing protein n=1 Tax=Paenibacillus forsythiae TaxID=365616 RepID=A0ABU3H387_9BACL|nr:hypothetical protein [Paenibacillus forsythiae]MDT3425283.1 hypothetical protein [Paenibacillus forsythiae]
MLYSPESLPFALEFFTDDTPQNTRAVREFWNRGGVSPKSIQDLVQVKEGVQIGARLYPREGFVFDPHAKLIIESSTYNDEGKQVDLEISISHKGDKRYLFNHERNQTYPWRLGVYYLEVHYDEVIYASAILVSPIHLSSEQVQHMHMVLEQEIVGICYELVYTSRSTGNEYELLNSKMYYDYVLQLINEKDRLYASLTYLERNLHSEVRTEYVIKPYERKVDHKGLRWKEMRASAFDLNKRKALTVDLPANQWIKHVISSWMNELNQVEREIQSDCKKQQFVIRNNEEEKMRNEERKRYWLNEKEVSKESKDSMRSITFRLDDEIKKAEKQLQVLTRWIDLLQNLYGRFGYVLSSTGLLEVSRARKKPQLKDRSYRIISDLYEQSRKTLVGESKSNHIVQILKPTWKVYEQFVFFQVVEILRQNGFSMRNSYTIDDFREMPSGFRIELENEHLIVHVWYDKIIYMRGDALSRNDPFYSPRLIQPDIRVDLYRKEEHSVFLSTLVMDAKHRKYKALHNDNYSSNVYSQLSKYNTIFYRGEHTVVSYKRPVVDGVLCVYSRDREAPVKKEEYPFTFIQLFPEIDQDQITGFSELMGEISAWIEQSKDN